MAIKAFKGPSWFHPKAFFSLGGFGTLFSLIVVYFIYLYAKDKGWMILMWIAKIYLFVVLGIIALFILLFLIILFIALILLIAAKSGKR